MTRDTEARLHEVKPRAIARIRKWQPSLLMEWAKFGASHARFNLARSGIPSVAELSDIPGGPYHPAIWGTNYAGHEVLKSVLASWYHASPENILIAQGASQCNFLIAGAALADGGTAIVEAPCYEPILRAVEVWADKIIRIERRAEDRFQPDPDELRRSITPETRLVMLTNLHNPTHIALNAERLREIVSIAAGVGATVVLDEVFLRMYDSDYSRHGHSMGAVSTNSLGKSWGLDSLRVGWSVGPRELIHRAYRLNNLLGVNQPYVTEDLAAQILSSPTATEWLTQRMRKACGGRTLFDSCMGRLDNISVIEPTAGISAFVRLPEGTDDRLFVDGLIKEYDTAVFPGHFYGTPGYVRVSFGGEREETREGLQRLAEAIRTL